MNDCPQCKSTDIHLSLAAGGRDTVTMKYQCRNCCRSFAEKWERGKGITVTEIGKPARDAPPIER